MVSLQISLTPAALCRHEHYKTNEAGGLRWRKGSVKQLWREYLHWSKEVFINSLKGMCTFPWCWPTRSFQGTPSNDKYIIQQPSYFGTLNTILAGKQYSKRTLVNFVMMRFLQVNSCYFLFDKLRMNEMSILWKYNTHFFISEKCALRKFPFIFAGINQASPHVQRQHKHRIVVLSGILQKKALWEAFKGKSDKVYRSVHRFRIHS